MCNLKWTHTFSLDFKCTAKGPVQYLGERKKPKAMQIILLIFKLRTVLWTIFSKYNALYEHNYNTRTIFGYMPCLTFQASGCSPVYYACGSVIAAASVC